MSANNKTQHWIVDFAFYMGVIGWAYALSTNKADECRKLNMKGLL